MHIESGCRIWCLVSFVVSIQEQQHNASKEAHPPEATRYIRAARRFGVIAACKIYIHYNHFVLRVLWRDPAFQFVYHEPGNTFICLEGFLRKDVPFWRTYSHIHQAVCGMDSTIPRRNFLQRRTVLGAIWRGGSGCELRRFLVWPKGNRHGHIRRKGTRPYARRFVIWDWTVICAPVPWNDTAERIA